MNKTKNYKLFKRLDGNRELYEPNVKKLVKSISQRGYIGQPVMVNENFEIIDGQHRFEALKRLGMEIPYEVRKGYGLLEMQRLNESQKEWSVKDTILSEAKMGNQSYKWLVELYEDYSSFGYTRLASICKNKTSNGNVTKSIKQRWFTITYEEYQNARGCCEWLAQIDTILSTYHGRKTRMLDALTWCYFNEHIDNKKLLDKIEKHFLKTVKNLGSVSQCLLDIETIYNKYNTVEYTPIYEMYMKEKRKSKKRGG